MSWLFSRALVEEYLEAICLDGEQSAPLSGNLTPQAYLSPDKMTDFSRLSRFGMTFKPLTESRGEELLTSFLEAFLVKTFPLPGAVPVSTVNGQECGDTWRGWLAKYDPDSCLWKTAQFSLLGDLIESLATLPRSGMTLGGLLWELPILERTTKETGYGSSRNWPTPQASDNRPRATANSTARRIAIGKQVSLEAAVKFWPTPTVCGNYNRKGASATSGDGLATAVRKYATPTARDWKSGKASQATHDRDSRPLSEQIGGSLNPTWVEWLMGWPLGWTDLKPLETGKFLCVPQQPLPCSQTDLNKRIK